MAFNESSGQLVAVAASDQKVHLYAEPSAVTVPGITLGPTTPGYFDAALTGAINPDGVPSAYRYEYRVHGTETWQTTELEPVGEGTSDVPVAINLSGLIQNTEYDLRLVGVATDSGAVTTSPMKTFTTNAVPPPGISAATGVTSNSATLHGVVNPQGVKAGWHFAYSKDGVTWKVVGSEQDAGTGSSDVPVSALASGLDPNTKYFAHLVVSYLDGHGGSTVSAQTSFTTGAEAPEISLVGASPVLDISATLRAYLDPRHSATTYYFEYGTDESYGTTVPVSQDGDGGSQLGPEGVLEQIEGLQPETTYHFRITATNQAGTVTSEDTTFTTRSLAEVTWPTRGIELVNSPDKGNQNVGLIREEPSSEGDTLGVPGLDPSGTRVPWVTVSGAPGSTTGAAAPFLAERTANGWVSRALTPPAVEQPGEGMRLYGRPVAATPDLSKFAFITSHGISTAAEHALVTVDAVSLQQNVIQVLSAETPHEEGFGKVVMARDGALIYGQADDLFFVPDEGTLEQLPTPACGAEFVTAAKASFSRVLLTSAGDSDCLAPPQLYSLEPESGQLELISGPPQSGILKEAEFPSVKVDPSGSTVVYRTATALTPEDANGITDLYRWQEGSGNECLTCEAGGLGSGSTLHASRDLNHIYIKTSQELVPGTDGGLFVWQQGAIEYVSPTAGMNLVTPDGETVVFWAGKRGITADRLAPCRTMDGPTDIERQAVNPCSQLYLYSEARGTIECISCPVEPQELGVQPEQGNGLTGFNYAVSDDGETVAFVTPAALTRRDINGLLDVYEWHNGVTRLVTSGAVEWPDSILAKPALGGISPDGRDIVFSVGASLTGHEADSFAQAFDARIGGGFPVIEPPAPCVEDACQGPLQAPPALVGAGSAAFSGPGNTVARHKAKRKKRRAARKHRGARARGQRVNHKRGGRK